MGNTFFFEWEVKLIEWCQDLIGSGFLVQVFSVISALGEELVCIIVLGLLYWGFNKEAGKYIGMNIMSSVVWNPLLKNIFLRRRPYFDTEAIKILKPVEADADIYDIAAQGYSFPSGHSTNSATVYGSIARVINKKWVRVLMVVIPLLVGISRFVLGAHYPTDVLVGWALGTVTVFLVPFLRKKIKNDFIFWGVLLLTGLPGFFYCTSNDFYTGYGILLGGAASFMFEERVVKFENTKSIIRALLRTACGGGIFVVLNALFKLPFKESFLESATLGAYLVRTGRYAIVVFIVCGLYPMLFKYTANIGKKEK